MSEVPDSMTGGNFHHAIHVYYHGGFIENHTHYNIDLLILYVLYYLLKSCKGFYTEWIELNWIVIERATLSDSVFSPNIFNRAKLTLDFTYKYF
jgi:hypothetical protein